jgi:hypothetical protein
MTLNRFPVGITLVIVLVNIVSQTFWLEIKCTYVRQINFIFLGSELKCIYGFRCKHTMSTKISIMQLLRNQNIRGGGGA